MNMRRPAMIAIVELHATTSGHGLRKPQFNSNANLQSERPVFRLTHRSIKHRHQQPAPQRPRWRRLRVAGEATPDAVTPSAAALGTRRSWRDFTRKPSNHRLAGSTNSWYARNASLRVAASRPERSCPGSLQQIRQCCDHENHIGARSHPDLWAAPCGAAERAPCCERGGEDRIRPTISAPGRNFRKML